MLAGKSVQHTITITLLVTLVLLTVCPSSAIAEEELEFLNRPVNLRGLTGLLFTASPFALSKGTVETGAAVLSEDSATPYYTQTEYILVAAAGLGKNTELAFRGSYIHTEENDTGTSFRGSGDAEIAFKWNFLSQPEYSARPAIALLLSGILPTGDNEQNTALVKNWGARIGIAVGTELRWEEHVLGIYADAQLAIQDLSDDNARDSYQLINAGLLFPISKYRNLQLLIEYSLVSGRDNLTPDGMDYSAVTTGLRLVSERFNLTFGSQLVHKGQEGYDNSNRLMSIFSKKF